jgi:ubiquinone/menaquinone biosynthesis C-methylase UbiE
MHRVIAARPLHRTATASHGRHLEEEMSQPDIKDKIKEGYGRVAAGTSPCCGASASCCGTGASHRSIAERIGYTPAEMDLVPEGANLGLGCGNPVALAGLQPGQTVLDLGSGAGFDCFLAARAVGESGRVIGVDMTPQMVQKAQENARRAGYSQVEFRLGDIESLPVSDSSVDVILSNCVINLSPDKRRVFSEAYRVLKPGGRAALSDVVLLRPLPAAVADSITAYLGCVAGASLKHDYLEMIGASGFAEVQVVGEAAFHWAEDASDPIVHALIAEAGLDGDEVNELARSVVSIKVLATKGA